MYFLSKTAEKVHAEYFQEVDADAVESDYPRIDAPTNKRNILWSKLLQG